jgi:hypothetical protein
MGSNSGAKNNITRIHSITDLLIWEGYRLASAQLEQGGPSGDQFLKPLTILFVTFARQRNYFFKTKKKILNI